MLLKFLLFIILVYLFFRLLGRYILPWLVRRYMKNVEKKFYQDQYQEKSKQKKRKKEGDININTKSSKSSSKGSDDELGDYVDFEEIDDDE